MSGEILAVFDTTKIKALESGGLQLTNGSILPAAVASYDIVSDGNGYPDGRFVLTCTFAAAPTLNSAVSLYARELGVDGAANTPVPKLGRPGRIIGSFLVDSVTAVQSLVLNAYNLPPKADYYLHNNGTGQSISAGWTLKVTPQTAKVA
jgi:hypothetical protein